MLASKWDNLPANPSLGVLNPLSIESLPPLGEDPKPMTMKDKMREWSSERLLHSEYTPPFIHPRQSEGLSDMESSLCFGEFGSRGGTSGGDLQSRDVFNAIVRHQNPVTCEGKKFIVTNWKGGVGLGAALKSGMGEAFEAALRHDRILIFAWDRFSDKEEKFDIIDLEKLKGRNTLLDCEDGGVDCFFLPMSTCSVSDADLLDVNQTAYLGEVKRRRAGLVYKHPDSVPPEVENKRIWTLAERFIASHDYKLVSPIASLAALQRYVDEGVEAAGDGFIAPKTVSSHVLHVTFKLYFLRMREEFVSKIKDVVADAFAKHPNFDPNTAVGLPIRASDKCISESDCLYFGQNMEIIDGYIADEDTKSVILTSESKDAIYKERTEWIAEVEEKRAAGTYKASGKSVPRTYDFILNSEDVMQGTGLFQGVNRWYNAKRQRSINEATEETTKEMTKSNVMASTFEAFFMQLHAKANILNCCSNFLQLLEMVNSVADCGRTTEKINMMCSRDLPEESGLRIGCFSGKTKVGKP